MPPEGLLGSDVGLVDVASVPAGTDISGWHVHPGDGARFVIDRAGRVIAIDSDRVACLPWERLFECARRSAASR